MARVYEFWDSQGETVRELVGPVIYYRIAKIFNLPLEAKQYEPMSETSSIAPSEQFYTSNTTQKNQLRPKYSMVDFENIEEDKEIVEEEQSDQSYTSTIPVEKTIDSRSRSKSVVITKSLMSIKSKSRSFSRLSKSRLRSSASSKLGFTSEMSSGGSTKSDDDLIVHPSDKFVKRRQKVRNPHFVMLYCNESETDMIKWKSKYKQKVFEVSASDEFSKKAEIMTKKIAKEFYDWWVGLGNVEFKSEIKRPEDIEDLFQVWFDEHASRGLVLDPRILPCVLQSIADYVGLPKASCPNMLKRQIASDIYAETSPAHTMAFGTCLPQKMKHIPPRNNTKKMWHCVKIPEDLRSMACVWEDIQHLTSTKSFQKWLRARPQLPMPAYLDTLDAPGDKKQPFVVPSDYVVKDKSVTSAQDLALPVSEFSLELKDVLSKLMNQ